MWYTTAEVAKMLGVKHDTITQHVVRKNIETVKRGRDHMISQEALDQFLANRRKSGRPPKNSPI